VSVTLAGATTGSDPERTDFYVDIVNDYGGDWFQIASWNNLPLSCGTPVQLIHWSLQELDGTALESTDLSRRAPKLDDFEFSYGPVLWGEPTGDYGPFFVAGEVISVHVTGRP
jgi:hypothetical protein